MTFIAFVWNVYLAAVLFSPLSFPVTVEYFNFSPVIFFAITLFGILTWWFTPEDQWLPAARLGRYISLTKTTILETRGQLKRQVS